MSRRLVDLNVAVVMVGIILAASFGLSMVLFCAAMFYDATRNPGAELSENATQVLNGWGGGVTAILSGVISGVVGHRIGLTQGAASPTDHPSNSDG